MLHDAIGIDPDSLASVAALVRRNGTKPETMRFPLTPKGRAELTKFILKVPDALVGIEGCHGQSLPLEELFSQAGIRYYSIPAGRIENYRKAMVGSGKNNGTDARAVAEFLLDLETKSQLERFVPPPPPDQELQSLARRRLSHGQHHSALMNQLWKLLKAYAHDLYLALRSNEGPSTAIDSKRLLVLFSLMPQLGSWKNMVEAQFLELSGGKQGPGWDNFVRLIQAGSSGLNPLSPAAQLLIRQTALQLLASREQQRELDQALEQLADQRPLVRALMDHYRGMGAFTAALIVGEIITVTRFGSDDRLASYAGLTKRDRATGANLNQVQSRSCNMRLKAAFITLARNSLLFNKSSHLEHYHRHLLARGVSRMEALKRISRALVRDVYRFMKTFVFSNGHEKGEAVAMGTDSRLTPWSTGNTALPTATLTLASSVVKMPSTS